jgi:preprotein translocase subunit SecB
VKARVELPSRVISAVEIEEVRLVAASATVRVRLPRQGAQTHIETSARVGEYQGGTLVVFPTIEVRVQGAKSTAPSAVQVKATFEVRYGLPKGFSVSRDELEAFAQTNAIFNVWPYWREFVQSVFTRMGLPPLTLPVFRLARETQKPAPKRTSH